MSSRGVLMAVAAGVSVANVYYAQPLLERIGVGLAVRPGALGLLTTVTQVGYLLGLVLIVPLGDLLSRRRMIVGQALVACAGLVAAGLARDAVIFFAACVVVGLASVIVQVIVAYAAALSDPGQRGSDHLGRQRRDLPGSGSAPLRKGPAGCRDRHPGHRPLCARRPRRHHRAAHLPVYRDARFVIQAGGADLPCEHDRGLSPDVRCERCACW
jgi:MFS transporter